MPFAPPFAVAGGTWIFLGVLIALFFIFVFGYYTRSGSGISQTPYRRPDGPPESPSELAHDITQDVRSWERGTEGHHRTAPRRHAGADGSGRGPGAGRLAGASRNCTAARDACRPG